MGENTKIEWAHHTFNPWVGCTPVSRACDFCYAENWAKRTGHPELWKGERRRTSEANWRQPLKWDRKAYETNTRPRVFCASLADVFDNQVPEAWRVDLWNLIGNTQYLDWLLLTKRPQNIKKMLPPEWGYGWHHVWLGTTAENQEEADRRIPHLLAVDAAIHFVSYEPALGPADFRNYLHRHEECNMVGECIGVTPRLDWIIAGGESGPKARPAHPQWFRDVRDQCQAAGVAYFFKQWGGWVPTKSGLLGPNLHTWSMPSHQYMERVDKKAAGAQLDGREWREMPA